VCVCVCVCACVYWVSVHSHNRLHLLRSVSLSFSLTSSLSPSHILVFSLGQNTHALLSSNAWVWVSSSILFLSHMHTERHFASLSLSHLLSLWYTNTLTIFLWNTNTYTMSHSLSFSLSLSVQNPETHFLYLKLIATAARKTGSFLNCERVTHARTHAHMHTCTHAHTHSLNRFNALVFWHAHTQQHKRHSLVTRKFQH